MTTSSTPLSPLFTDALVYAAMQPSPPVGSAGASPDELMRTMYRQINAALGEELLDRIAASPPEFFERLMVRLLLAMGLGGTGENAGRAIGRSGDDGVDGVIDQDPLGIDRVYVQAKRYQPENKIGASAIRDFFGSLDVHKATKGLFVMTSGFTPAATETAAKPGNRKARRRGREALRRSPEAPAHRRRDEGARRVSAVNLTRWRKSVSMSRNSIGRCWNSAHG